MVASKLCASCQAYYDRMGRKDGSCGHVQRQPKPGPYSDAELDILIGRGAYRAEEIKDAPGENR